MNHQSSLEMNPLVQPYIAAEYTTEIHPNYYLTMQRENKRKEKEVSVSGKKKGGGHNQ